MCEGIAIARWVVPDTMLQGDILRRLVTRSKGAEIEVQFHFRDRVPVLPIFWCGELHFVEWGSSSKRSLLPRAAVCWQEHLEAGRWANLRPEPVDVPACFGYEKGIWYQVTEGMRGVVVSDEAGKPHAYLLTMPATHYYEIMTRHQRMPVLIGQTI